MNFIIGKVRSVNGHKYRDVEIIDNVTGFPIDVINEVLTPHCGWKEDYVNPTCEKGCDTSCKLCQTFFDEIGVEY